MTRSLIVKISIGAIIFLLELAYQIVNLRRMVPSVDGFGTTTSVTGTYSYERLGRNTLTRIGGRLLYCGVNYQGGHGSCYVFLKDLPRNSRITATVTSIDTMSGHVLYAMSVNFDGQEVYATSPRQALHDWWFSSRLATLGFPLNLLEAYCLILMLTLIRKKG